MTQVTQQLEKQSVPFDPVSEARKKLPRLDSWTDRQIIIRLNDPRVFRGTFPEQSEGKSDLDLQRMLALRGGAAAMPSKPSKNTAGDLLHDSIHGGAEFLREGRDALQSMYTAITPLHSDSRATRVRKLAEGPIGSIIHAMIAGSGQKIGESISAAQSGDKKNATLSAIGAVPVVGGMIEGRYRQADAGDTSGAIGRGFADSLMLLGMREAPDVPDKLASTLRRSAAQQTNRLLETKPEQVAGAKDPGAAVAQSAKLVRSMTHLRDKVVQPLIDSIDTAKQQMLAKASKAGIRLNLVPELKDVFEKPLRDAIARNDTDFVKKLKSLYEDHLEKRFDGTKRDLTNLDPVEADQIKKAFNAAFGKEKGILGLQNMLRQAVTKAETKAMPEIREVNTRLASLEEARTNASAVLAKFKAGIATRVESLWSRRSVSDAVLGAAALELWHLTDNPLVIPAYFGLYRLMKSTPVTMAQVFAKSKIADILDPAGKFSLDDLKGIKSTAGAIRNALPPSGASSAGPAPAPAPAPAPGPAPVDTNFFRVASRQLGPKADIKNVLAKAQELKDGVKVQKVPEGVSGKPKLTEEGKTLAQRQKWARQKAAQRAKGKAAQPDIITKTRTIEEAPAPPSGDPELMLRAVETGLSNLEKLGPMGRAGAHALRDALKSNHVNTEEAYHTIIELAQSIREIKQEQAKGVQPEIIDKPQTAPKQ